MSTTGVGGPDAQGGHPAGTVFLGWATAEDRATAGSPWSATPRRSWTATVDAAVGLLAFHAEGLRPLGPRRGQDDGV